MPRRCTVCAHEARAAIDAALVSGATPYDLHSTYIDLSREALQRHKADHLPEKLLKAKEAEEIADADNLTAELKRVIADVHRLRARAEEEGDLRTALLGVDKALRAFELQAKLAQLIDERPQINLNISPEWLELRAVIVGALEAHPEAQQSVIRAIEGTAGVKHA